MEAKDFLIAPLFFVILTLLAYIVRPYVTTPQNKSYFLPALWVRFVGAIALGLIYQFHYKGGDTFSYFTHGSRWIWEATLEDPIGGIALIFKTDGEHNPQLFSYTSHIWYFYDPHSYVIVRIAAFFDLFTFHTYAATAMFFAFVGFSGSWAFYSAIQKKYHLNKYLTYGVLFMPSIVLWGSGLMKDTITLAALGWLTWGLFNLIELKKRNPLIWIVILLSAWIILSIKIYILICFVPLVFVWLFWQNILSIRNAVIRVLITPFLLIIFAVLGYFSMQQIASTNSTYNLDAISERVAITANDIRYGWGARDGGDGGYDLGALDGSWGSMIRLGPQAVVVSMFRPFLWEVRNPFMLLAALESFMVLIFTFRTFRSRQGRSRIFRDPFLLFSLLFAVSFAFAVGVSTYNFGTLMRYKLPLIPFYLMVLFAQRKPINRPSNSKNLN